MAPSYEIYSEGKEGSGWSLLDPDGRRLPLLVVSQGKKELFNSPLRYYSKLAANPQKV